MKRLLLVAIMCLTIGGISAKSNIDEVWKNMPDSVIPYLNAGLRAQMIEDCKSKTDNTTKNILEGESKISRMTNNFIDANINKYTNLKLLLLDRQDSTQLICMVRTFCSPAAESHITFYNTDWTEEKGSFGLPDMTAATAIIRELTERPDTMTMERYEEIAKKIEPAMCVAEINEKNEIYLSISCPLLTKEEREALESIKKQKRLKWTGDLFK